MNLAQAGDPQYNSYMTPIQQVLCQIFRSGCSTAQGLPCKNQQHLQNLEGLSQLNQISFDRNSQRYSFFNLVKPASVRCSLQFLIKILYRSRGVASFCSKLRVRSKEKDNFSVSLVKPGTRNSKQSFAVAWMEPQSKAEGD